MRRLLTVALVLASAVVAIRTSNAQDPLPNFIAGLDSHKKNARLNSAIALGNHGTGVRSAAPALKALVDGEADPQVAFEAVRALTRIGAHAQMRELLRHGDQTIRWQSLSGLSMIGPPAKKAVPELLDLLTDPQPLTRMLAAQALGEIGLESEEEMRRLVRMLRDADPDVRQFVVYTLLNVGPNSVPALEQLLEDTEPIWVRVASLQALANQGPQAKAVVPKLIKLLRDPEPELRAQSALTLAAVGANAKEVLPTLLENLLDKNMQVQVSAFQAALTIGQEDRRALSNGFKIANAKGRWAVPPLGKDEVPGLIKNLSGKDDGIRIAAALALGQIGNDAEPAIPQLTRMLKDENPQVQNAARQALAQLDRKNREAYLRKVRLEQAKILQDFKADAKKLAALGARETLRITNPDLWDRMQKAKVNANGSLRTALQNGPQQAAIRQLVQMHVIYSTTRNPPIEADWVREKITDLGQEAVPAFVDGLNYILQFEFGFV